MSCFLLHRVCLPRSPSRAEIFFCKKYMEGFPNVPVSWKCVSVSFQYVVARCVRGKQSAGDDGFGLSSSTARCAVWKAVFSSIYILEHVVWRPIYGERSRRFFQNIYNSCLNFQFSRFSPVLPHVYFKLQPSRPASSQQRSPSMFHGHDAPLPSIVAIVVMVTTQNFACSEPETPCSTCGQPQQLQHRLAVPSTHRSRVTCE